MESSRHRWLKRKAALWLRDSGMQVVGQEVSLPWGRCRADVAAWRGAQCDSCTAIVEVKATRADFIRDALDARDLLERRRSLHAHARALGITPAQLTRPRPLRAHANGDAGLFAHADGAFDTAPAKVVRRMRLQLAAINRQLHGRAKFAKLAWWRTADRLWVVTPRGMLRRSEIPTGWGLVEFDAAGDARFRLEAPDLQAADASRDRMLVQVAKAASRDALGHGVLA